MTSRHFFHILFVRNKLPSQAYLQGKETAKGINTGRNRSLWAMSEVVHSTHPTFARLGSSLFLLSENPTHNYQYIFFKNASYLTYITLWFLEYIYIYSELCYLTSGDCRLSLNKQLLMLLEEMHLILLENWCSGTWTICLGGLQVFWTIWEHSNGHPYQIFIAETIVVETQV